MRILVLGAGVIGSVYAGKLLEAGHEVVLLARGSRLADLQSHGLLLEDAQSGNRTAQLVASVSEPAPGDRFDLVLVPVRSEQLASTLTVLTAMTDGSDVLFFGNTAGYVYKDAPAIALPAEEHALIRNLKGDYSGTAEDLISRDFGNLRDFTNAPAGSLQSLSDLIRGTYPGTYGGR